MSRYQKLVRLRDLGSAPGEIVLIIFMFVHMCFTLVGFALSSQSRQDATATVIWLHECCFFPVCVDLHS